MKILLFGKSGQVGWECQRSLSILGEVIALDSDSQNLCGDFTNLASIAETVRAVKPPAFWSSRGGRADGRTGCQSVHQTGVARPDPVRRR